jgi:hypothetical protein
MTNREIAAIITKTPLKLRATIAGTCDSVNIEKADFKSLLLEMPDIEQFDLDIQKNAMYVESI